MADITTLWSPELGIGDWYLPPIVDGLVVDEDGGSILDEFGSPVEDGLFAGGGDLLAGNDLGTAILISLFTDAGAGGDDQVPDGSGDPRGWWGDLGADRTIGSKLWLRLRAKQTDLTLALVRQDIRDALRWLIDDGVASAIDVETEWSRPGMLGARVVVHRAGTRAGLSFAWAWKEIG